MTTDKLVLSAERRIEWFPATAELAYLDTAYRSPLSRPAAEAAKAQIDESMRHGSLNIGASLRRIDKTRAQFAAFVGAQTDEICFTACATDALIRVTLGLDWRPGERVVAPADDYPGLIRPLLDLKRRGVEVTLVQPREDGSMPVKDLLAACDAKTRLVAASHVSFRQGRRLDVHDLCTRCRARGVLTAIDYVQSAGALRLNMGEIGCDFATFAARKWLCSLDTLGVFYVRADALGHLTPHSVGLHSVAEPHNFARLEQPLAPGSLRFHLGATAFPQTAALSAALGLFSAAGMEAIEARVLALNAETRTRAQKAGLEVLGENWPTAGRSGICAVRLGQGQDDDKVRRALRAAGVVTSVRAGTVRVSTHFFNDENDLARLFAAL